MNWLFMVGSLVLSGLFPSTIERALTFAQNHEWAAAAMALDQAALDDPALFNANNFPYLRGRVAENLFDWPRARQEFQKIPGDSSLHPLSTWHAAMATARVQDYSATAQLFSELSADFPADLKMELARVASTDLALKIYLSMSTRDARVEHALVVDDKAALWSLIRERKDDDAGLEAARLLSGTASSPKEMMEVADTFVAHRQFDYALPLYQAASRDPMFAADSRYQIGRLQFLREDFRSALETYRSIAKDFQGTDWEEDSEYQIASCFWRLGEYRTSEQSYLKYISKYGSAGQLDNAIRNLVDVYRILNENQKAIVWIDRALAKKLPLASRQVFIFTKAKILYTQKRYAAAALLFRQLGRAAVRPVPGGTTRDEARYFEALSVSKAGNTAAAKVIWKDLASAPYTYYGARSIEKIGGRNLLAAGTDPCRSGTDPVLTLTQTDLISLRRPMRTGPAIDSDAVSELVFLQLWDEASMWGERRGERLGSRESAELAYLAGRYHRTIAYAGRLPKTDPSVMSLLYPAGFHQLICSEAAKNKIDPLWLHAIIWQESKYNPHARSGASARGLMQFIPETANAVGAEIGLSELSLDRLYDPAVNLPMGAHYWASLMNELKNPIMALAAYNGGIDNVRRWKAKWPAGDDDFFVADIGFTETKRYVLAVFGARAAYGSLQ